MSHWYLLLLLVIPLVPLANADRTVDDYGIELSKKCLIMIKNNIDSDCPTYEQLLELFPDTSPRHIMGDFEIKDNIVQRGNMQSKIDNCWHFLVAQAWTQSKTVWIDPPGCVRPFIKMITIESNFHEYPLDKNLSSVVTNNTIVMGNERYVNFGCTEAIINAEDSLFLAGDTLNFMNHGCDPEFTNFDHIKKFTFERSDQDIATSSKYKLDEFFKNAKEKYKVSYIGSNEVFDNAAVTTDENE